MNITPGTITTLSSREFNQDTARAKRAAGRGPVFITSRGTPSHVLLTIEDYRRLRARPISLADALAHPESTNIDFDIPEFKDAFKGFEFD